MPPSAHDMSAWASSLGAGGVPPPPPPFPGGSTTRGTAVSTAASGARAVHGSHRDGSKKLAIFKQPHSHDRRRCAADPSVRHTGPSEGIYSSAERYM